LPLLQTIAITFTGAPIPFGKINFPPAGMQKLIDDIKNAVTKGKEFLKKEFVNKLKAELNKVNAQIKKFTDNNFAGFKKALPDFFNDARANVVTARNELMSLVGNAQSATDQKFLGVSIGQLSILGNTLYEAHRSFENHTNELSGVAPELKTFTLQELYGTPTIFGTTVTISSVNSIVQPDLLSLSYPILNVGDTVIVNSQEKEVIGKKFTTHVVDYRGNVSIDTATANTKLTSSSLVFLNLANVLLDSGGITKLAPNMYITVNNEIRQINTINAKGDFLTVYTPFKYNATEVTLDKETGINVNSAFSSTLTTQQLRIKTPFVANSVCLDNVITGNATTFTSSLSANDKIFYDDDEYFVVAVTDTTITVDEPLRKTSNSIVYKVVSETPFMRFGESNGPDDIIGMFSSLDQLTGSMGGNLTKGMTTKFQAANGTYVTISAAKPLDTATSLQKGQLVSTTARIFQNILDNFQNDAIRSLQESELVALINETKNEVENQINELKNSINQDLAAMNAVKGLLSGLFKLFSISCGKKKKKDNNTESDEYLDLILVPNPIRQGCSAEDSDLIDIFDEIDAEFNDPNLPDNEFQVEDDTDPESDVLLPEEEYVDPPQDELEDIPGPDADIAIDDNDPIVPPAPPDPCAQPC
jgi:hypothetical protein